MKSNLPATNPLQAKSVTCTSSSGSEGRNPSAPSPAESSPSSCAPEGGASGEFVQQWRAGGRGQRRARPAAARRRAGRGARRPPGSQPMWPRTPRPRPCRRCAAARRPRRRRRWLATRSSALQRRTSRLWRRHRWSTRHRTSRAAARSTSSASFHASLSLSLSLSL